jgi:hypothetical protein
MNTGIEKISVIYKDHPAEPGCEGARDGPVDDVRRDCVSWASARNSAMGILRACAKNSFASRSHIFSIQ